MTSQRWAQLVHSRFIEMMIDNEPKNADDIVSDYFNNHAEDDLDLDVPDELLDQSGLHIEDASILGFDSVKNIEWHPNETLSETTVVGTAFFDAQAKIRGILDSEVLDDLLRATPYTRDEDTGTALTVNARQELSFRVSGRVELGSQTFESDGRTELED